MSFPAQDIDTDPIIVASPIQVEEDDDIEDTIPVTTPVDSPQSSSVQPTRSLVTDHTRIASFTLSKIDLEQEEDEVDIPVFHTGEFYDWRWGEFEITRKHFNAMKRNFENKVLHPNAPLDKQIALQVGHGLLSDPQAVGWVKGLRLKKGNADEILMYATIGLNSDGRQAISEGRYAFISPSFDMNYMPQKLVKGERIDAGPTLFHFALTNTPVLAELPSIALSKTATPMDVDFKIPKEVVMTQPQEQPENQPSGDGGEQPAPTVDPNKPPTTTPQPNHEPQGDDGPPPAEPVKNLSIPQGMKLVSENEYNTLSTQVQSLTQQFESQARKAHELSVDGIIKEAASRGVPPAVLSLTKAIMLTANPQAAATVNFAREDGNTAELNIFQAMGELLEAMPKVAIAMSQFTREPSGERPAGQKMSMEEAEAEGRKLWAMSGVAPQLIQNGKGNN